MSTSQRVRGHNLLGEGMPFNAAGGRSSWALSTGGEGYGKCSCGALSPFLTSSTKRKAWHREHKAEMLAAAQPEQTEPTAGGA